MVDERPAGAPLHKEDHELLIQFLLTWSGTTPAAVDPSTGAPNERPPHRRRPVSRRIYPPGTGSHDGNGYEPSGVGRDAGAGDKIKAGVAGGLPAHAGPEHPGLR